MFKFIISRCLHIFFAQICDLEQFDFCPGRIASQLFVVLSIVQLFLSAVKQRFGQKNGVLYADNRMLHLLRRRALEYCG